MMISQSFETLPPATFTVMGSSLCEVNDRVLYTRPFKTSTTTLSDGSDITRNPGFGFWKNYGEMG